MSPQTQLERSFSPDMACIGCGSALPSACRARQHPLVISLVIRNGVLDGKLDSSAVSRHLSVIPAKAGTHEHRP
jgi:hypothetical protein